MALHQIHIDDMMEMLAHAHRSFKPGASLYQTSYVYDDLPAIPAGLIGPSEASGALLHGTGLAAVVVKPAVVGGFEAAMRIVSWAHARSTQVLDSRGRVWFWHCKQFCWAFWCR